MARTPTPPLIPPKAPEQAPATPPQVHETFDVRRRADGKCEIVRVHYAEGLSETEVVYESESGPLAAKAWTLLTRRKIGLLLDPGVPLPPLDLQTLE